jgi:FAD/FMN-containing dehydrogenase
MVRPVPYRVLQTMLDSSAARGNAAHWRSVHLAELSDPAIDQIVSVAAALPTPFSLLNGWMLGGLSGRIAPAATAFGERGSGFELRMIAAWAPGDEPRTAWVRESWQRLAPYSDGRQYATFLVDEGIVGVRAAYGAGLARLVALKDRYDPANVFRLNANIPPSAKEAPATP